MSGHIRISPAEQACRRDGLDSVIGTMAAYGESIPADTLEIFEQYVRDAITAEERDAAFSRLSTQVNKTRMARVEADCEVVSIRFLQLKADNI